MKISATAHGGFTGLGEHYDIDTRTNRHGRALEAALASQRFFSAQSDGAIAEGADLLRWTITVDDSGRQHTIVFHEDGTPAGQRWQDLLARIRAAA